MLRLPTIALLFILLVRPAFATTGNEWTTVPEAQQAAYIRGVLDAWANVEAFLAVAKRTWGHSGASHA